MNIKTEIEKALCYAVAGSDIADYQCNAAFGIAKTAGRAPFDVACEISDKFNKQNNIAVATPHKSGFVNFKINDSVLETVGNDILTVKKLPIESQNPRTIFFDYGGANVAKELHIGHLRPLIVGEALRRVFGVFGHKTIADPHWGDWGLQMGLVLAELDRAGYISDGKFVKTVTLDTLNILYPAASSRAKTDKEFWITAQKITKSLQEKTEPFYGLWKTIRGISLAKIIENYKALGCTFDIYNGESDAEPYIKTVIDILKNKGAYESDGCLVYDVKTDADKGPMPPVIITKANGGDLYATTDIATIYARNKEYNPNEYVYVTDFRQALHFEQVFRTVKKSGIVNADVKFVHVPNGSINGTDGKPFKTRSGDTIKLEDVINLLTDAAGKRAGKNARAIGIAALKFADLSNSVRKDYIFDINKAMSFEGKTGPYLLYTVARINSILKKHPPVTTGKISTATRDIFISVVKLTDSFAVAAREYSLNSIADATYNLAQKFNLLYANENIGNNPDNLWVAGIVKNAMKFALDALAIQTVEEM